MYLFVFLSSGGWGKIKLKLTTLTRIFIRVVYFGTILLEASIGRDFGALKELTDLRCSNAPPLSDFVVNLVTSISQHTQHTSVVSMHLSAVSTRFGSQPKNGPGLIFYYFGVFYLVVQDHLIICLAWS